MMLADICIFLQMNQISCCLRSYRPSIGLFLRLYTYGYGMVTQLAPSKFRERRHWRTQRGGVGVQGFEPPPLESSNFLVFLHKNTVKVLLLYSFNPNAFTGKR